MRAASEELSCPKIGGCENFFTPGNGCPKTLPCLHTFCVSCLDKARDAENKLVVSCPECRTRYCLKTDDLRNELKTDYFLLRTASRFQALSRAGTDKPRCDSCSAFDNEVEDYCEKCSKLLCHICSAFHQRADDTRSHEILPLEKMLKALQCPDPTQSRDPLAPFTIKKEWQCEERSHSKDDGAVPNVKFFCLKCEKMTCRDCAIAEHSRPPCTLKTANVVCDDSEYQYKSQIERELEKVKETRDDFAKALDTIDERMDELDRAKRLEGDNIKAKFTEMQTELLEQRESLLARVKVINDTKLQYLEAELESLIKTKEEISRLIELVGTTLEIGLPEEILSQEKEMLERLEHLQAEFSGHPRKPSQRDTFVLTVESVDLSGAIGSVYTDLDLQSLTDGIDQVPFVQDRETELQLTCRDAIRTPLPKSDREITIEMEPDTEAVIKNNQNGTYTVKLRPHSSGVHAIHVKVQVEDQRVSLAPVTINVSPALLKEVQITQEIRIPGMMNPAGVAVCEQTIVVTDRDAHKLFVLNEQGDCLNVIGEEGIRRGEFKCPQGVAFMDQNMVVVADTNNRRIQILSLEGDCITEFGRYGNKDGEFIMPTDVAVSQRTSVIYVTDSINHSIQYFKPDGTPMGIFRGLDDPVSLCLDEKNRILVAECSGNQFKILAHKCDDNKLQVDQCIEHSGRSTPEPRSKQLLDLEVVYSRTYEESTNEERKKVGGIAYDPKTQYVFITEKESPCISVYAMNGTYVGSISCRPEDDVYVQLSSIAIVGSCVITCDSSKRAIFVMKLF